MVALLSAACFGPGHIRNVKGPESAMVYGNIRLPKVWVANQVTMNEYGVVYVPLCTSVQESAEGAHLQ